MTFITRNQKYHRFATNQLIPGLPFTLNRALVTFQEEMLQASFHFPLHRYLAAFVCQAVTKMGMSLTDVLPTRSYILPLLMMHPLRVQVTGTSQPNFNILEAY